jgi:CHAT domain-containing protein
MKHTSSCVSLLTAAVLLLAGCATGTDPGGRNGYGLEPSDIREAIERGEGREALAYYERAAEESERRGSRLEAAKAHAAVAQVANRIGAYQKGIRSGLRALELLKGEPQGQDIPLRQVRVYSDVGHSYRHAGDLQEARRYFEEGLELIKSFAHLRASPTWSGNLSRGLASVAYSQHDYPAALQHGSEAVRFLEDQLRGGRGRRFDRGREGTLRHLAMSLVLVGRAHRELGNFREAETTLGQALGLGKQLGAPEVEAEAVASLARVALARTDYSRALEQFQEALMIATRLDRVSLLISLHRGIGQTYAAQGRFEEALTAFRRSVELVEDLRDQLQEAGLRTGFLEDKQSIYHGAARAALALGKSDEAFGFGERARARAFLDLLGNHAILSKGKTRALVEEEVRLRAQLSEARALVQDAIDEGNAAGMRQQVLAAERAYRAFLDRVRKENLEQASLMTVEPVTLQEVQGLLPEGTTLLEYLVTAEETLLWVIDRQRLEVVRLPVARRALVTQVRGLRQAIADQAPIAQIQGLAERLYERLFAGARPHVRGDRLLIVPHDVLHYLPFGALRSPEGRWLVEDYTFSTLPSASVLKYLRGKGADASERALALGNPDLGPALTLRYAEREARAVGERYPRATVLVRREATEARAKALSEAAGLLHFATHGELSEQDPLSSALLLVPDGTEDGRLEVRELFGLDLRARLVVLSACETGLGKLSRGDELVGLQRAFLYAGTPAVVTTLWKVDDRASFVLMREFYTDLQARGPAQALRQAQRAAMAQFPHPFAWAAFSLTGVPR